MLLWSQWFYQYLQPQLIKRTGSVYTAQLLCFILIESNSRLTFHGLMDLMVLLKSKLFNFPVFYVFPSLGKYIIWPNCGLIRFENYQILFLRWLYKKKSARKYIQERPTQMQAYYVLYNVRGICAPTKVEGKGVQRWCDITVQKKTS